MLHLDGVVAVLDVLDGVDAVEGLDELGAVRDVLEDGLAEAEAEVRCFHVW